MITWNLFKCGDDVIMSCNNNSGSFGCAVAIKRFQHMRPTFIYSALKTRSPSSCVFVFRIEALELLLVISCFLSWRKHHRMPLLSYISFYHYGLPVTSCFESSASSLPWWVGAGLCAGCLMGCILFKLLTAPRSGSSG